MLAAFAAIAAGPAVKSDACGRLPSESDSFGPQWAYITSEARTNVVMCSRRSGKTVGARLRAIRCLASRPGARILYITLIRKNCRKLFWHPLKRDLDAFGWTYKSNETDLNLVTPNGSYVEATSVDDVRDVGKIRGDNWDLVIIDECQEPRDDILEMLVDHVLAASFIDHGGDLDLLGTPPATETGFFVEQMRRPKAATYGWTMFDNPHINHGEIHALCEERGIGPGHAVYEREIMGRLVIDPGSLAYEYRKGLNDFDPAEVDFADGTWRHAMGIDLGFQDCDAIVVVGWRRDDGERRLYERYCWAENHNDVDRLADKVDEVRALFKPSVIVADHGGHGAVKVLETLKNRMGIMFQSKPSDVMLSVGLVNDDLRTGRLLLSSPELIADMNKVQRTVNPTTKRVEINKRGYHSDRTEGLRYAHHAARHYASKAPKPVPDIHDRRILAIAARDKAIANPWR